LTSARKFLVLSFATGFGTGYFPFASGTFSTLIVGIPVYLLLSRLSGVWYSVVVVLTLGAATVLSAAGDRILGESDSHKVVIDEISGFLVTMWMITPTPTAVFAGFFLFRFFDIVKVQPAKWIDGNLRGGPGVVLDDVVAGVYANLCLRAGMLAWSLFRGNPI